MINKVLILGKMPPPIGGVRIHVRRLIANLSKRKYPFFHFYNLEKESIWKIFLKVPQYKVIHLHTSNAYFQLILAIYCLLIPGKLIITYHGNWGRHGIFKNFAAQLSALFAFYILVLNDESLKKVIKWNKNSLLVSAFIPPHESIPLNSNVLQKILNYQKKYKYLFCTNASNLTFDKNGKEIYGISSLIAKILKTSHTALLVSDPSGTYKKYIESYSGKLPENIFFITGIHDFYSVLKLSDAFIRNTTTDGDSISIHEAILCNIPVFATDCVSRPNECMIFKDISAIDLIEELERKKLNYKGETVLQNGLETVGKLILLYNQCLLR